EAGAVLGLLALLSSTLVARAGSAGTGGSRSGEKTEKGLGADESFEHVGTLNLHAAPSPVDPLVAAKDDPFFPSRACSDDGALTVDMFTSAEACKECHSEISAQWSGSMMAHAWT